MDHNENETTALETAQTAVAWMTVVAGAASAIYVGYTAFTIVKDEIQERRSARRGRKAAETEND